MCFTDYSHCNRNHSVSRKKEVKFDYETTEYEVGAFSECHCGAANCRGTIAGFKHNADSILSKYGDENVAEYLVEWASREGNDSCIGQ